MTLRAIEAKLRRYPVTCAILTVSAALFVAARINAGGMATWGWGWAPDLWSGKVWILWVNALHHGSVNTVMFSILHIVFNFYWLWRFGRTAEEYFKPLVFGVFLFACQLFLALASELSNPWFGESGAVGLSGVVYGLFGLLFATRFRSDRIRTELDPYTMQFMFGWLFIAILIDMLNFLPFGIAHVAHFGGFAYGWCFGKVLFPTHRRPAWWRISYLSAHALLLGMLAVAIFPWFNPDWHNWKAARAETLVEQEEHLRRALEIDPDHALARYNLALILEAGGRHHEAREHRDYLKEYHPDFAPGSD